MKTILLLLALPLISCGQSALELARKESLLLMDVLNIPIRKNVKEDKELRVFTLKDSIQAANWKPTKVEHLNTPEMYYPRSQMGINVKVISVLNAGEPTDTVGRVLYHKNLSGIFQSAV